MQNGLYKVEFATPLGQGTGIVVLRDGQLLGGDDGMFYAGKYRIDGNRFTASVMTGRHSHAGGPSVFGVDSVAIELAGTVSGDSVNATGSAPQAPGVTFRAQLKRIAQ